MKMLLLWMVLLTVISTSFGRERMETTENVPTIIVTYAGSEDQLRYALNMIRSIRAFAGVYADAQVWVYCTPEVMTKASGAQDEFEALNAELKAVSIPEDVSWYILSGMVYSAAAAEDAADGKASILVFMGSDTVVLEEPSEFKLPVSVNLGYRPVMHRNINPLYSEELDVYWSRAYEIMGIDESAVFPMVTPADSDTIRPYIQAGLLVVRPNRGLLRKWPSVFEKLCADSTIKRECEEDSRKRVFTFQVALTGTILTHLRREEMIELSDKYNYPVFFKEMFGAKKDFHDITNIATIRCEGFFDDPIAGWEKTLKGPADRIEWMRVNLISEDD